MSVNADVRPAVRRPAQEGAPHRPARPRISPVMVVIVRIVETAAVTGFLLRSNSTQA
jgi:hypothetical protein